MNIASVIKQKRSYGSLATPTALVIILLAALLRLLMISFYYPTTMSDESVMDLMARHIAYDGARPIFFYGQAYMGPIEAYLGAFFFHLFGSSIFAVRLGLIIFYVLFLWTMYALVRLLYSQGLALFTLLLLMLGNTDIFDRQLKAIGGYPEMLFFGALILLLASQLALSLPPTPEQRATLSLRRLGLYATLGFTAGLALYVDQLSITFAIPALLLLMLFCWRERFSLQVLCGILMFLLGISPLIYYNLSILGTSAPGTLHDIAAIQGASAFQMAQEQIPQINKFIGTFFISLPSITGYAPMCSSTSIFGFGSTGTLSLPCMLFQGMWSLGYLALLVSALLLVASPMRRVLRIYRQHGASWPYLVSSAMQDDEYRYNVRQAARAMLLLNALLALAIYIASASPATNPGTNTRYLLNTLISLPAILWPLWRSFAGITKRTTKSFALKGSKGYLLPITVLTAILLTFITGTIICLESLPQAKAEFVQQERLVNAMISIGATRIYTDYWTCYRLAFQSEERITCANLDSDLRLGDRNSNRYAPYLTSVEHARTATYVFQIRSDQYKILQRLLPRVKNRYKIYRVGSFAIYQFAGPIHIFTQ
ncbi:hypothetical protein ccbrp13_40760 [Ktedonobacteria bacterium brp13]|nr:hypothetical protein ccbrp13_40760 [Ktedonobacteria bacterium brp13]